MQCENAELGFIKDIYYYHSFSLEQRFGFPYPILDANECSYIILHCTVNDENLF